MLSNITRPLLPPPTSWYPGHMSRFAKLLPTLLSQTDVVLELRDARLPLTSINHTLEGALQRWRLERGHVAAANASATPGPRQPAPKRYGSTISGGTGTVCERIVVFSKRDLVQDWGIQPFTRAMQSRFPDQRVLFASWHRKQDIRNLLNILKDIARLNPHAPELNVLVVGMPNVGKSTLLNTLRHQGIAGPTAKALQTSALPGMTRALSTRLKLCEDPKIYAFDSPGVMLPFLGKGEVGAERGVKLALIAGLKEGLYDIEALAAYLIYRFNILNAESPAYLPLLPPGTAPTDDLADFLDQLARRLGMVQRGGIPDQQRAAKWFIQWWRERGGLDAAASPLLKPTEGGSLRNYGWGFDIEWSSDSPDAGMNAVQQRMEECIDSHMAGAAAQSRAGGDVSMSQEKRKVKDERAARREVKVKAILAARGRLPTKSRRS